MAKEPVPCGPDRLQARNERGENGLGAFELGGHFVVIETCLT
jgi:hypothetical protein